MNSFVFIPALALLSFVHCIAVLLRSPDMAFYLPTTRAWELLSGSLMAVWLHRGRGYRIFDWPQRRVEPILQKLLWEEGVSRGYLLHDCLALFGLLCLGLAVLWFNDKVPYPGLKAIIPVVGAASLIMSPRAWFNRSILSSRPFVWIGLVSYPFYLWHFPLLAYSHVLLPEGVPWAVRLTLAITALALAILTYRFLELPTRRAAATVRAMWPWVAVMALIGITGAYFWRTGGIPSRLPDEVRAFYLTGEETSVHWRRGECLLLPDQDSKSFAKDCIPAAGAKPRIVFWGDSYAAAMAQGFVREAGAQGYQVGWVTTSACPPLLGYENPERRFCRSNNDWVMAQFEASPPDIVVLHSTWSYSPSDLERGLEGTVKRLRAAGVKRIVLLGPVATWLGNGLPDNFIDYYYLRLPHAIMPKWTSFRSNLEWSRHLDGFLREQAQVVRIPYVSPLDVMCPKDLCLARVGEGGRFLSSIDTGHVTVPAAIEVAGALLPKILNGSQ